MLNIGNTLILEWKEDLYQLPNDVRIKCKNIIHVNENDQIHIMKLRNKSNLIVLGSRIYATDKEKLDTYIKQLNDIVVPIIVDEKMASMVEIINNVIAEYTIMVAEELK